MITHNVKINGLAVNAVYSEEDVRDIFLPLLFRFTLMQEDAGRRILVILAAPPAAGKSTLLSFLQRLSLETEGVKEIQTIGMDGFHRRQEYLISHYAERDGESVQMVDIKGAPETFDLPLLTDRIKQVADGGIVGWPEYDRTLHNPVEDAIVVSGDILLLEGNYLLLDRDGWRELSNYADYTIRLSADEELLRERLIVRKMASGTPEDKAVAFVDFSDMANVRECLHHSMKADMELMVTQEGFAVI